MSHCQSFLDITGALLVLVNAAHENNIINTTIDTHILPPHIYNVTLTIDRR